jgi:hypothetical protein
MRTISRSLVAAATSLPLLFAGAGAAVAAEDTSSVNTAHPVTVSSGYDGDKGHGHGDKGHGHGDKGHGHDDEDDGVLEDLLDELFGDDYGDSDYGDSDYSDSDGLLGLGIL